MPEAAQGTWHKHNLAAGSWQNAGTATRDKSRSSRKGAKIVKRMLFLAIFAILA